MADLPTLGALELLQRTAQEETLREDATRATIRLARQVGAVYNRQALAALESIQAQAPSADLQREADEAMQAVRNVGQSPEGFLVAWLLAGPYFQDGQGGPDLFDVVFPPEKPEAKVEWRPVTVAPGGRPGLVEMDKIFGGNDRVAYLRTHIESSREQDAMLQIGSDDGVKVWLNGQVVHANNATRPNTPDQDQVSIKLKQGSNLLLIKITQGGGEWTACCRLRAPDGKELTGITVAPQDAR